MSIKAIARDLYRAQQKVNRLEQELEGASAAGQETLNVELQQARNELAMLRRILQGEKESAEYRKKFKGFGR